MNSLVFIRLCKAVGFRWNILIQKVLWKDSTSSI